MKDRIAADMVRDLHVATFEFVHSFPPQAGE
jgi:hypothetical protein